MVIVWGMSRREVKAGKGNFYCPQCKGERRYTRIEIKDYFTLFYIPIFPIDDVGGYVKCETCKGTFKLEALLGTAEKAPPKKVYTDAAPAMPPVQMNNNKPINSGNFQKADAQEAFNKIARHPLQKQCPSCHLTCSDAKQSHCNNCGTALR